MSTRRSVGHGTFHRFSTDDEGQLRAARVNSFRQIAGTASIKSQVRVNLLGLTVGSNTPLCLHLVRPIET
jgi:hypothetical protein